MTRKDFDHIVSNRCEVIQQVLLNKGCEYADDTNAFRNFERAARLLNTTRDKALLGMLSKHLVSVMDLINGDLPLEDHIVSEKIGDTINYLILLEAMFYEDIQQMDELPF
jgi:hypothetical protein